MTSYFIRRFLLVIPTFLGITLLVFVIMQLVPGGPLEQELLKLQAGMMAGGETTGGSSDATGGIEIPPDALAEMRRFYGFDKPLHIRYLPWLGHWRARWTPSWPAMGKARAGIRRARCRWPIA
jgi:microcin C transport system permease protein